MPEALMFGALIVFYACVIALTVMIFLKVFELLAPPKTSGKTMLFQYPVASGDEQASDNMDSRFL